MINLFRHFVAPDAASRVADVLASRCIGQGPVVDEFEQAVADWIGENVTVSSGTAALEIAYDLAMVRRGDYVISTPLTCCATNIPLARLGAVILWADVDPLSGLIDVEDVTRLLSEYRNVRAIVSVDYGGALVDYTALCALAVASGAQFISDAAHSFGMPPDYMPCHFRCYSYQAIKMLTTVNGGSLSCHRKADHERALLKRWFGLDRTKGDFRCSQTITELGYKAHMSDIEAAVGLANLPYVARNMARHAAHADAYNKAGLNAWIPERSTYWLYNMRVPDRDRFIKGMHARGVQCAQTHARNDRHPIFASSPQRDLPGVREFDEHQVSIPVGWHLEDDDVGHVAQAALEVLEESQVRSTR